MGASNRSRDEGTFLLEMAVVLPLLIMSVLYAHSYLIWMGKKQIAADITRSLALGIVHECSRLENPLFSRDYHNCLNSTLKDHFLLSAAQADERSIALTVMRGSADSAYIELEREHRTVNSTLPFPSSNIQILREELQGSLNVKETVVTLKVTIPVFRGGGSLPFAQEVASSEIAL